MSGETLLAALGLALLHLLGSRLRFLDASPRSRWLSAAGGVAVAYAVVHLLPELQEYHGVLQEFGAPWEHSVYVLALIGLIVFYGLEKAALMRGGAYSNSLFWLHVSSYGIYNALIGYLLVQEDRDLRTLVLFSIGIGLHFIVNDHSLWQHHREQYRRFGRWVLAAAILVGWGVGIGTELMEAATACVVAFLAGGIVLNTFKEELPGERESRFWAFTLGALAYAAIMIAI